MIGVVIPTLNSAEKLPGALDSLSGLPIWTADGGSTDGTQALARDLGCTVIDSPKGRGIQVKAGVEAALANPEIDWLLVLHSDTKLKLGWRIEVDHHCYLYDQGQKAATFTLQFDDDREVAQAIERWVRLRVKWFGLPYGDQGLLIHRDLYQEVGGFKAIPLMEDVDLARRLGRRRIVQMQSRAVTSAARYRKEGFRKRGLRNLCILSLYYLGIPPKYLAKLYA